MATENSATGSRSPKDRDKTYGGDSGSSGGGNGNGNNSLDRQYGEDTPTNTPTNTPKGPSAYDRKMEQRRRDAEQERRTVEKELGDRKTDPTRWGNVIGHIIEKIKSPVPRTVTDAVPPVAGALMGPVGAGTILGAGMGEARQEVIDKVKKGIIKGTVETLRDGTEVAIVDGEKYRNGAIDQNNDQALADKANKNGKDVRLGGYLSSTTRTNETPTGDIAPPQPKPQEEELPRVKFYRVGVPTIPKKIPNSLF